MSTLWEAAQAYKPPRTAFLDFPLGCPAGKPGEPELQRAILRAALDAAPTFGDPWTVRTLPFEWAENGNRAWEDDVRQLYQRQRQIVATHQADHRERGESLVGHEKEFTIRCDC